MLQALAAERDEGAVVLRCISTRNEERSMRMECPHCEKWATFTKDCCGEKDCHSWICDECEAVIYIPPPKKRGEAKLKE